MSGDHGGEFTSVDTAAYKSPMLNWSPLSKLFLIISLLVLDVASKNVWMSVFTGVVGLTLFMYGSLLRPPKVLMYLFLYAQLMIIISAILFMIVTPGATVATAKIGITIHFTDAGVNLATLIYARATVALLLLYSFAVSTPVPHLAEALRKIYVPDVFVEMMVLIYRYTFLLMETAESMHLAAECKFGYSNHRRSMGTTAKLAAGVFMRALDTAEKGEVALQCRNYRGEFKSLSTVGRKNKAATALCAVIVIAGAAFFIMLRYGVVL